MLSQWAVVGNNDYSLKYFHKRLFNKKVPKDIWDFSKIKHKIEYIIQIKSYPKQSPFFYNYRLKSRFCENIIKNPKNLYHTKLKNYLNFTIISLLL